MGKEPPTIEHFEPIRCVQGLAYALLLIASSVLGTQFVLVPLLPLAVFRPALFRQLVDFLVGFWLVLPSALMELWFGVQLFVCGDRIDSDRPALIIMNHRTRLDWLYFWNALWRMDPWLLTTGKISLKKMLKHVPGAGWAMSSNAFMFLDRSFASDKQRMDEMISYYKRTKFPYQLLLFPEGTDKCPNATKRSRAYAERNNLPNYDHLLLPRTVGFAYMLQRMRREQYIDFLYDVTVGYQERIVQSEYELIFCGLTPSKVHFLVRKIPITDLPDNDAQLEEWLKTKWAEKEELLHNFYTTGGFPNGADGTLQHFELSSRSRYLHIAVLAIWLAMTVFWAYLFCILPPLIRCASALLIFTFFVAMQTLYGGLELGLARLSKRAFSSSKQPPSEQLISNGTTAMKEDERS